MPTRCPSIQLTLEEHVHRLDALAHHPGKLSSLLLSQMAESEKALLAFATAEKRRIEERNPLANCQPSYFQTLKLNSWMCGRSFLIDFDCNRGGKTVTSVLRIHIFMCPPPPSARIWQPIHERNPLTSSNGHPAQCLPPPAIGTLHNMAPDDPLREMDPRMSHLHPSNLPIFLKGVRQSPMLAHLKDHIDMVTGIWSPPEHLSSLLSSFDPFRPENLELDKPLGKHHELWHGSPNHKKFKEACASAWNDWTPQEWIARYVEHEGIFDIKYPNGLSLRVTSKSYDSASNVFASDAVRFILLTEGPNPEHWQEIRIRFEYPALGSWDYTVVEPSNTNSVAHFAEQVYKGKEPMPLNPIIFSDYGLDFVPRHILDDKKRADMIRMYANTPQGAARLGGRFYSTTPRALSNLDRELHCIPFTLKEIIQSKFSKFDRCPLILFRGYDEGSDSPSACVWAALAPDNTWYVYRAWAKPNLSIGQRCKEIIERSGNIQKARHPGRVPASGARHNYSTTEVFLTEQLQQPNGERIAMTMADYHIFKTDQVTGRTHAMNYAKEGLNLRASITAGPEERALLLNRMLEPIHPGAILNHTPEHESLKSRPRARIYFLMNEPGVPEMIDEFEEWYWERKKDGEPKDKVADKNDHLADALCYIVLSPYKWSPALAATGYKNQFQSKPDEKYYQELQEFFEDSAIAGVI